MQTEIKKCPLIGFLRNGKDMILFQHDVVVESDNFLKKLTSESIANISTELFKKGYDIASLSIDESRISYMSAEEMGW